MKLLTMIIAAILLAGIFVLLYPDNADAQGLGGVLMPQQKALLDYYYLQTTSNIDGSLIITNSIPFDRLGFFVVTQEVDPELTIFLAGDWLGHTNNSSAHHARYTDDEVTNVVSSAGYIKEESGYTNWAATNALNFGINGIHVMTNGTLTTSWYWVQGVCTQIVLNGVKIF